MKRFLALILVFCLALTALFAQDLPSLDAAVKGLAVELNKVLIAEKAGTISIGDFSYAGLVPPFGQYLSNQLIQELVNFKGPYSVSSGGASGVDLIISGEIIQLPDTVRVYTRLISSSGQIIKAAMNTDFNLNDFMAQMLYTEGSRRGGMVIRDAWEPDSMDEPVPFEIGPDESTAFMDRTIHNGSDEDFFLLVPARDGRIVMETSGSVDTYLEFYDAGSREMLGENDDGGSSYNARLRYSVTAGRRYIVKIRGYGSDDTGPYGFRAYYSTQEGLEPDQYENDDEPSAAKLISIEETQQRSFHHGDDVDWIKFQVTNAGRHTIRARGVNSNYLDTFIRLYDVDINLIDEDDDGGANLDSRLSVTLDPGFYYIKVLCLDDDPDQPYIISIEKD